MPTAITLDVLDAYLICKFKAQLRLDGHQGAKSDYEAWSSESRADVRLRAIQKIRSRQFDNSLTGSVAVTRPTLSNGDPVIIDADLRTDRLSVHFGRAQEGGRGPPTLGTSITYRYCFTKGATSESHNGSCWKCLPLLLARVQGRQPGTGIIYHGSDCAATTIRFAPGLKTAQELLAEVMQLQSGEAAPKLLLKDHCQVCEFRQQCHVQAVAEDNVSLLRGLGEKEIKGLAPQGAVHVDAARAHLSAATEGEAS